MASEYVQVRIVRALCPRCESEREGESITGWPSCRGMRCYQCGDWSWAHIDPRRDSYVQASA